MVGDSAYGRLMGAGGMAIRANPTLAKVAYVPRRPQTDSAAAADQPEPKEDASEQQQKEAADELQDSRGEQQGADASSMQDGDGAHDREAEGTPPESSEAASAADEARKAQRRRCTPDSFGNSLLIVC